MYPWLHHLNCLFHCSFICIFCWAAAIVQNWRPACGESTNHWCSCSWGCIEGYWLHLRISVWWGELLWGNWRAFKRPINLLCCMRGRLEPHFADLVDKTLKECFEGYRNSLRKGFSEVEKPTVHFLCLCWRWGSYQLFWGQFIDTAKFLWWDGPCLGREIRISSYHCRREERFSLARGQLGWLGGTLEFIRTTNCWGF